MWLLPSIGRPAACQYALDACEAMGMTAKGLVFVDGPTTPANDAAYRDLRLPENWTLYFSPERKRLTYHMQWVFQEYPHEARYGWLADDTIPLTPRFDQRLEAASGDWEYAQANDGLRAFWPATRPDWPGTLTAGLCWGGELVRAAGFWAYPKVVHAAIDGIWALILRDLGWCHYLPDVLIEHHSWRVPEAHRLRRPRDPYDANYDEQNNDVMLNDYELYKEFRHNGRQQKIVTRIQHARVAWEKTQQLLPV